MSRKHNFKHGQFVLHCAPMPMADGRFGSQVVISSGHDGPELVERLFSSLAYFDTEAEAVEHAKQWGIRWVDDNG